MKGPNPIIGWVPCPIAGCKEQRCPVRKFKKTAGSDQRERKGGKLYFDCPTDGRFGFDGKPAMQDYVLENITWADESARAGAAAPEKALAAKPSPAAEKRPAAAVTSTSKPAAQSRAAESATRAAKQTPTPKLTASAPKGGSWADAWEDL